MSELKRTPLYDFHVAHGGKMVDFAGWEMPVQYGSILEEHKAVRQSAGLFDVSHMGEFDVAGPNSSAFLNHLLTNDVSKLFPGKVLYSPMCYHDGGVVDDLLVYLRQPDEYLICVNAGNIDKDLSWFQREAEKFSVRVSDRSSDYALLAIQGPKAGAIVQSLTGAKLGLLKYYHFCEGTVAGVHCIISRTGYTGEDGIELYHASDDAASLAEAILDAGSPYGLILSGLGARDSLRLEAGYPLYGHELSAAISPMAAGLGWTVKLEKGCDFIGRASLLREKETGGSKKVIYFKTGDRRIVRAETSIMDESGARVGRVLSGTLSPLLNEAIGSALVDVAAISNPNGSGRLQVDIRGASVFLKPVTPPFVDLKKSSQPIAP